MKFSKTLLHNVSVKIQSFFCSRCILSLFHWHKRGKIKFVRIIKVLESNLNTYTVDCTPWKMLRDCDKKANNGKVNVVYVNNVNWKMNVTKYQCKYIDI